MNFSNTEKIKKLLVSNLKIEAEEVATDSLQPIISIKAKDLLVACEFLFSDSNTLFDLLNSISAIDNGPEAGTIDLTYTLTSIPLEHSIHLKIEADRNLDSPQKIYSVSSIWKTAEWHEREIFDFFGVKFSNHPDLRRILLPADWKGHPLRKDYEEQSEYHGIKVKY
ncbi:MAG: NADH-quinone oxidoreductase subunit C [Spirosomataceae bacterium]|jgi:NADH-quinone oxidoreductase subunit C